MKKILRLLLLIMSAGFSVFAVADPVFGTKKDLIVSSPSANPGNIINGGEMLQMVLALAAVAALLKWVLPRLIGMFTKKLSMASSSNIHVLETSPFGPGQLHLVRVRHRTLLLSATPAGVQFLADVTGEQDEKADAPVFFELLDQVQTKPTETLRTHAVVGDGESEMSLSQATSLIEDAKRKMAARSGDKDPDQLQSALDRLQRLTS